MNIVPNSSFTKCFYLLLLSALFPHKSLASLQCSNDDIEAICLNQKCVVSASHTPMQISIDQHIQVCAYSSCSDFNYQKTTSNLLDIYIGDGPTNNSSGQAVPKQIVMIVDNADQTGILKHNSFTLPLICKSISEP